MNILVFGSLNQDIVHDVDHFGQPGETTKALAVSRFPGGKGLNQAVAASLAGSSVGMAGTIGPEGGWLTDLLQARGVDTSLVLRDPAARTGTAIIERDPSGQNRILLDPGANSRCTRVQVQQALAPFGPDDLLVCQNETNVTKELLEEAGRREIPVLFNPAPMTPDVRDLDLQPVTLLAVNENECRQLLDSAAADPLALCRQFRQQHPDTTLLLTLGSRGAFCLYKETLYFMPAYAVPVTDTTGAGDTWLGYFADGFCRGLSLPEVMKRATAAAALGIQEAGAASSIPDGPQMEAFMAENRLEPEILPFPEI